MESQTTSKTILIVGGGTGIGFEATKSILKIAGQDPARDTKVMIFGLQLDEDVEVLAQTYPQRVRYLQGDVTVPEERERGLQMCLSMMGGIDTLIYCAAVMTPIERIEKVDVDAVRRTFDVNVFGAMAMVRDCSPFPFASHDKTSTDA